MPFSSQDPDPHNFLAEAQAQFFNRESSPQDADQLEGLFSLLRDLELELDAAAPALPASGPTPASEPAPAPEPANGTGGQMTEPPSPTPATTNGAQPSGSPPPPPVSDNFDLEEDFWQASPFFSEEETAIAESAEPTELVVWPESDRPPVVGAGATLSPFPDAPAPPDAPVPPADGSTRSSSSAEPEEGEALERLRDLLSELLIGESSYQLGELENRFQQLEQQWGDPQMLGDRLLPLFASLLERKATQAPEEVIQALLPVIDRAIAQKSQTDKAAMSVALAAALPGALSKQIGDAPHEVVQAIAPVMGRALREQVRLERDAMVDALYPVIGNTVSKYMGEVVRQINQRVEETFSLRGLSRKLRARWRGVSEAELILSEAMPFSVQAVFLIHKASGLVMVEVQQDDRQELEADMLAGMLTAIRSFASECTVNPEKTSELTEIDYEDFKIVMEVAGYCYIAAVTQGEPPASFVSQLRQALSAIILNYGYGDLIAEFDGDPDSIPQPVRELLTELMHSPDAMLRPPAREAAATETPRSRLSTLVAWTMLLGLLAAPFAFYGWQQVRRQQVASQVQSALAADPDLAVYQLDAIAAGGEVRLQGKLPSEALRQQAIELAAAAVPDRLAIASEIQMVNPPPEPGAIQAELERLTQTFNAMQGVQILSSYDSETNRVKVEGNIHRGQDARVITEAFEQIPGVDAVVLVLATAKTPIQRRIYFDTNSTFIDPYALESKLMPIRTYLNQYPDVQLRIVGHTDESGSEQRNRQLAPARATAVKQALVASGIAPERLQTDGSTEPPPDVRSDDPLWLSRAVHFEQIAPAGAD